MNTTHLEITLQIMYIILYIMHDIDLYTKCQHNYVVYAMVEVMMIIVSM